MTRKQAVQQRCAQIDDLLPPQRGLPLLELRNVTKSYPGVRALKGVSIALLPGEVHMLVGENGAGKSSIIKVLCGAQRADTGEVLDHGRPVNVTGPADMLALGVSVIFQEFSLVPHLTVAQNIFLGREPRSAIPFLIDHKALVKRAQSILDELGSPLDPQLPIHTLGVADQQIVEIAKALSRETKILILDEPTSALSDKEAQALFAMMRKLKARGVALLYISHRMNEIFDHGDRITVLRDGEVVGRFIPAETNVDELIECMVGRPVDRIFTRTYQDNPGEVALEVKGLSASTGISDISLTVRTGEIVGLVGLVGSGRTEVARAIFGADARSSGQVRIFGREAKGDPSTISRHSIALIPEHRKEQGLALSLSVEDNVLGAGAHVVFPTGWRTAARSRQVTDDAIRALSIATPTRQRIVQFLSGGNQQKVVLAKWLAAGCRVFIFDEPTRGIDVGAKAEIFRLVDGLVRDGAAVLMISSELVEIQHMCDRAYVMREGTIVGELGRTDIRPTNILRVAMADKNAVIATERA